MSEYDPRNEQDTRFGYLAPGSGASTPSAAPMTETREELLALANEYEAGLNKCAASGYEEYGPNFQRRQRLIIDALRASAQPMTETKGMAACTCAELPRRECPVHNPYGYTPEQRNSVEDAADRVEPPLVLRAQPRTEEVRQGMNAEIETVGWAILQALHEGVEDGPQSWSDMASDQEKRIKKAAVAAIEAVTDLSQYRAQGFSLFKRPVAFRVPRASSSMAGETISTTEWRYFTDEAQANAAAEALGIYYQGLYVRDGISSAAARPTEAPAGEMQWCPLEPTAMQVNSACLSFRHDFGLLEAEVQSQLKFEASEWLRAWQKEGMGADRNEIIERCAAVVDQCNREGPYNAIAAAPRIRALKSTLAAMAPEQGEKR